MKIRTLNPDELDWANTCYEGINFKKSSPQDFVAVAEVNEFKVGLGRIVSINMSAGELGGMHVLPEHQGKAIAGSIVDFLIENSQFSVLYCIPFAHLVHFYQRHGFSEVAVTDHVPENVVVKFNWCKEYYPEPVILMHRPETARQSFETA